MHNRTKWERPPTGSAPAAETRGEVLGVHDELERFHAGHLDHRHPEAVAPLQVVFPVDEDLVQVQRNSPADCLDHRSRLVAEPATAARIDADAGRHTTHGSPRSDRKSEWTSRPSTPETRTSSAAWPWASAPRSRSSTVCTRRPP